MIKNIIGHEETIKQLQVATISAQKRNKGLPHILFSGVAGCGKTTMATELAKSCDVDFLPVSPDDFKDREATMKILEKLNHDGYDEYGNRTGDISPTVLFVDEIHRMPRKGQEVMGIAMEKFLLESGKANKYCWVPYFTLVGATTDDGELTKPFREKFKLRFLFETYSEEDIRRIVLLHAVRKDIHISWLGACEVAKRSRGIPRLCVSYLERLRDFQTYKKAERISQALALEAFDSLGVDDIGLTKPEIRILQTLHDSRDAVGLDNLAIIANESKKNILNTIEPFLIQKGLIVRTGKGRQITDKGVRHLEKDGFVSKKNVKMEIGPDYVRK